MASCSSGLERGRAVLVAGAFLVVACSSGPARSVPPSSFVSISLVGLTLGPGKMDGAQWDGPGGVLPSGVLRALGTALGAPAPGVAVLELMNGPMVASLEKPDASGVAEIVTSRGPAFRTELPRVQDSFTPQFSDARWTHVPMDGSARLRVEVIDRDVTTDDPMGTLELNAEDFRAAAQAGHVHPVRVDEQTNRQVLFASISVIQETP